MHRDAVPNSPGSSLSRRNFLFAAGAVSLSGSWLLTGCGDDDDDAATTAGSSGATATSNGRSIGVNLPFTENDPWRPLMAGAQRAADERGYELLRSASNLQIDKQLNELNTWIGLGVAAITIYPLDPTALKPVVDRAIEQGIKVVAYASEVPGAQGTLFFDDRGGGRALGDVAAKHAMEKLGGMPKVALITNPTAQVSRERMEAMIGRLQELVPDTEVVAEVEGSTPPDGLAVARPILEANPDVNMFLSHNDPPLAGVGQALLAAGRQPEDTWLGGMDGAKIFLDKLLNGDIVGASATGDLVALGEDTVTIAANLVEGKEPTEDLLTYTIVTSDQKAELQKFIDQYAA